MAAYVLAVIEQGGRRVRILGVTGSPWAARCISRQIVGLDGHTDQTGQPESHVHAQVRLAARSAMNALTRVRALLARLVSNKVNPCMPPG